MSDEQEESHEGQQRSTDRLDRLERLELAVFGDRSVNAIGLMKRVSDIEEILERWQRTEMMIRGALLVMGLSTVANVAAVAKLLGLFS